MDRLGRSLVGGATVRGNKFELFSDTQTVLAAIVRDVDTAKSSVLMEFYIWNEGGAPTQSSKRSFARPAVACSATC